MRQMTPMVTVEDRQRLSEIVQRGDASEMMVLRARIVLDSGARSRREIARELGVAAQTVAKWWRRYGAEGINGLYDRPRSGKPRRFARDELIALITRTLSKDCPSRLSWSVRSVARETGLSPATVGRAWRDLVREQRMQMHGDGRGGLLHEASVHEASVQETLAKDAVAQGASLATDAAGPRVST